MALFVLPWVYVPDTTQSRALFNAKLYFGVADQDPILFPKDVTLIQEDGSSIVAEQPIRTNSGGTPTYDGSPVAIDLTGDYSLRVLDRNDQQIYEYPSLVATDDNLTANALRAAALRLNLDADEIGTTLITNAEGQSLDNAEYLLDTDSGLLYSLPDDIPAGSTVVSSSGTTLITSNGQFEMAHQWVGAPNRHKGNQNWNVEGSTGAPLPSEIGHDYTSGDEISAGRFCLADMDNTTLIDGILDADTGSYYIDYGGDFLEDYYGVKLADGSISKDGCALESNGSGGTRLIVSFDDGALAHEHPHQSELVGVSESISDDESFRITSSELALSAQWVDVFSSRSLGVYEDSVPYDRTISVKATYNINTIAMTLRVSILDGAQGVPFGTNTIGAGSATRVSGTIIVPANNSFKVDLIQENGVVQNSGLQEWFERIN